MLITQLERLQKDSDSLLAYADVLKKEGEEILMKKILSRRNIVDEKIKELSLLPA
jgi:hypothetical protein